MNMSPNVRRSLRNQKKIVISPKAKNAKIPLPRRSVKPKAKASKCNPSEESEVMLAKNAVKELRVFLERYDSERVPEPVSRSEEGEKDLPEPDSDIPLLPLTNGEVKEIDPAKDRRLSVKLQCCEGMKTSPVEEVESRVLLEGDEKSDVTPNTDKNGHFDITEVIQKYSKSHQLNEDILKIPNGDVEEVMTLSSDEEPEKPPPRNDNNHLISHDQPAVTVHDFFDDQAEEGEPEEDEGSTNSISDYGEPICLSESESEADEYDRSDPFICDDSEEEEAETEGVKDESPGPSIIIHENVRVSEIKDENLRESVKEVIDSLVLGEKRKVSKERGEERKNEINHWEVDSAGMMWYVEALDVGI